MLVLRPTELRISLMMVSRSLENKKANLARSQRQPQISFAVYGSKTHCWVQMNRHILSVIKGKIKEDRVKS